MEINIKNIHKNFQGKEVLKGVTLKIPDKKSTIICNISLINIDTTTIF